ncbi:MAG TPA: hypothetical protein VHL58_01305 [Thermoanaerobaculia bacterium]|nr:hypothetical protein [Thermoanaerobaculia bacterium]
MTTLSVDIPADLSKQLDRLVRDGWFDDGPSIVREALLQFVEAKSYLGDSPRMLHRFAADALNESKPETALKFVDRALTLQAGQKMVDLALYQQLVEMRVQILLVLERLDDARRQLEEAKERLPNNPSIAKWLQKLDKG